MELLIAVERFIRKYSSDFFILFNSSTLPHRDAYNNVIMDTIIPIIAKWKFHISLIKAFQISSIYYTLRFFDEKCIFNPQLQTYD